MTNHVRLIRFLPLMFLAAPQAKGATSFIIQIVVDNDFAFYVGSDTVITRELYQNQVIWNSQVTAASTFSFELEAGETQLYVLSMGGSGEENISGLINSQNIVQAFLDNSAAVQMSNPITSFLSGYNTGAVSNGTYTPLLDDVQLALDSSLIWVDPTVNSNQTVIVSNPFADNNGTRQGFAFDNSTAVFFRVNPEAVGVDIVPEPSSAALALMALAALSSRRRR